VDRALKNQQTAGQNSPRVSMGPTNSSIASFDFFRRCRCLDHLQRRGHSICESAARVLRETPLVKETRSLFRSSHLAICLWRSNGTSSTTCNCSPIPSKSIVPIRMIQMSFIRPRSPSGGEGQCAKRKKNCLPCCGALVEGALLVNHARKCPHRPAGHLVSAEQARHRRTL